MFDRYSRRNSLTQKALFENHIAVVASLQSVHKWPHFTGLAHFHKFLYLPVNVAKLMSSVNSQRSKPQNVSQTVWFRFEYKSKLIAGLRKKGEQFMMRFLWFHSVSISFP